MELEEQKLEQFKGQARLPEFAVPKRYDLTIKLDLSACTFSGSVLIDVFINGKYVPSDIVVDGDDEILVLVSEEALDVGYGALEIEFSGVLNEQLKGLYRCISRQYLLRQRREKNMVATQFELVDARRCFPCYFKITLESIPSELTALSNMPISEEKHYEHLKIVHFEESLLMSTYLVAIVVGLLDYVEDITDDGTKVRVYCPVGKSEKGKFALNIALKHSTFLRWRQRRKQVVSEEATAAAGLPAALVGYGIGTSADAFWRMGVVVSSPRKGRGLGRFRKQF
ncbi:Aminopeptidase M1 [Sesamum angolense]|uniref:Aminopeptidase M1 n=1 Tax=Sesamum angolense TaxID=2727404 RepID=A0AAE2BRH3_9LAMI|nr:Aminopeptidase M1 [Sesamum angolense]